MKLLYCSILLMCSIHLGVAQQVPLTWSQPLVVSPDTSFGSLRPRIAVTDNGNVIVAWGKAEANSKVYCSVKAPAGTFSTPEVISGAVNCRVAETDGPSIASKGNVVYIVYTSWPFATTHSYSRKSTDGGLTWASPVQTDNYLFGNFAVLPHITIDHVYNPHAAMVRVTPAGASPVAGEFCSVDQGGSYVSFVPGSTLTAGNAQDCSLPFQTTAGSTHVIVYRNNNSGLRQVFAAKSLNNGATFSSITSVDNTPWNSAACVASGPEGSIWNDTLLTVWMTENSGVKKVRVSATRLTTMTASTSRLIDSVQTPSTTQQDYPVIAGDLGIVGVAWQAKSAIENNYDVALAVSVTGFNGLNHSQLVNAAATSTISEKFPAIAYHDSVFHMVYVDSLQNKIFYVSASLRTSTTGVATGSSASATFAKGVIYPNPATNGITLSNGSRPASFHVYDILGRLVMSKQTGIESPIIDISSLSTGLYFYRAVFEKGNAITGKLMKIR